MILSFFGSKRDANYVTLEASMSAGHDELVALLLMLSANGGLHSSAARVEAPTTRSSEQARAARSPGAAR
jgi:hypothetical protein